MNTPRNRTERYDQMTKQEQLIEQKKREIESKLAVEKQRKEMESIVSQQQPSYALGQSSSSSSANPASSPVNVQSCTPEPNLLFANDGSFFEQFRRLQEQQKKEKEETKVKEEPDEYGSNVNRKPTFKLLNPNLVSGNKNSCRSQEASDENNQQLWAPPPPPPLEDKKPTLQSLNKSLLYPPPPPPPPRPTNLQVPNQEKSQGCVPQWQPSPQVKILAEKVADSGDEIEEMTRKTRSDDPLLWFLFRPDSKEYKSFRDLVVQIRNEKSFTYRSVPPPATGGFSASSMNPHLDYDMRLKRGASSSGNSSEDDEREMSKKRKSRWGPQSSTGIPPPTVAAPQLAIPSPRMLCTPTSGRQDFGVRPPTLPMIQAPMASTPARGPSPMLSKITRTNPQLLSYARQSYGTIDLDDEQWKQCEEAYKMNLLFQDIARKKARDEQFATSGKFKYEYDSDEEVDDAGTWEHKKRLKEMEKTREWADDLTAKAKGKHHIGDFLPPEELQKFMNKYKAVKEGRQMDESAYQDFKIAQDNVGFKLLQKMGWSDGQALGASGQGIVAPIEATGINDKQGLGVEKPSDITDEDDEYTAYRKRMMLAYRFRPNPLNNPRRAYY